MTGSLYITIYHWITGSLPAYEWIAHNREWGQRAGGRVQGAGCRCSVDLVGQSRDPSRVHTQGQGVVLQCLIRPTGLLQHLRTRARARVCVCVRVCACVCVNMRVRARVHVCLSVHVWVCLCVSELVCV